MLQGQIVNHFFLFLKPDTRKHGAHSKSSSISGSFMDCVLLKCKISIVRGFIPAHFHNILHTEPTP